MSANADELLSTLEQKAAPGNAALVVVDVQNDFAAEGGYFASIGADVKPIQRSMIPSLVRLIEKARAAGVLVVFIQAIYDPQYRSAAMVERKLRLKNDRWPCQSGTWGAEFYGVRPFPGEPIVVKHRYSGVINTELDAVLKRHGVKSLLMTGIATDTCVESTARDAYFIDYYVAMVSDCCGAISETDHLSALRRFERDYGPVVTSAEIIAAWTDRQTNPAAVPLRGARARRAAQAARSRVRTQLGLCSLQAPVPQDLSTMSSGLLVSGLQSRAPLPPKPR